MPYHTAELLEALTGPTTIPIVPYRNGQIDFDGHAKNISYLMRQNRLSNGRPRIISVAGTSLIHHIDPDHQTQLFDVAGQVMGHDGVLMSAIAPNPIGTAGRLVAAQAQLQRPPDVYLIMPLTGVYDTRGLYQTLLEFGRHYGEQYGARFLYYLRAPRDRDEVIRLIVDSPHFIGVKIGTDKDDVRPMVEALGKEKIVIWGIGDRSTEAAELGAKGHTSGTAVLCTGICDGINNAQRRGDYTAARQLEAKIDELENIRFLNGRVYNYSAVVEAMRQCGFDDVQPGDCSGPFNPPVPAQVAADISRAVQGLAEYH